MLMLHYTNPSKLDTKKIVFEEKYMPSDPEVIETLKELSSGRTAIERLTSHPEQKIQKLEEYLPNLMKLVGYKIDDEKKTIRPFSWKTNLCRSPEYFNVKNIYFELSMTLFLYASVIRDQAYDQLASTADLAQSCTSFRRAAGVFVYLVDVAVSPASTSATSEQPALPKILSRLANIMNLICLAEAQAVTARKAEEKGSTPGVLSKLHYGIAQFLNLSYSAVSESRNEISSRFQEFIYTSITLHELKAYKYLAKALTADDQNIGAAIGIVRESLVKAKKYSPNEKSWRNILKQEIKYMEEVLRKYERENYLVHESEKIPSQQDLPSPQGKKIVDIIPYEPNKNHDQIVADA